MSEHKVLRLQSAKDAVTEEIRRQIHEREIEPGDKISIDELATSFGVSRTPVRDALFQLSSEGLVEIQPRIGVFVREITEEEILDVYRIKELLEPQMAAWAAERGGATRRQRFYESVDLLDLAAADHDVARYVAHLEDRREALLEMAGSSPLRDCLSLIDGRVRLLRFRNLSRPEHLDHSAAQHRVVARAIADRDAEAARAAMAAHMRDAQSRIRSVLTIPDAGTTVPVTREAVG